MTQVEMIEAATKPLDDLKVALHVAASQVRIGQEPAFDPRAAVEVVDRMAAFVGERFRTEVWRNAAAKTSKCHATLYRMMSGDTVFEPADLLIELAALREIIAALPPVPKAAAA